MWRIKRGKQTGKRLKGSWRKTFCRKFKQALTPANEKAAPAYSFGRSFWRKIRQALHLAFLSFCPFHSFALLSVYPFCLFCPFIFLLFCPFVFLSPLRIFWQFVFPVAAQSAVSVLTYYRQEKTERKTPILPTVNAIAKCLQTNQRERTPEMPRAGIPFHGYWHLPRAILTSLVIDINVCRERH